MYLLFFLCILPLFFSGCFNVPPADEGFVSCAIDSRIAKSTKWFQDCDIDDNIKNHIQCLLEHELSVDDAIQIALWNNPQIQASFEELGIARANLIEAGLFTNPSFELEVRYPKRVGLTTNIEYLITSSILDIILIPLRNKLAATEFEQVKLKVTNQILSLAFEVRENYYELMLEQQKLDTMQSLFDLADINYRLITQQFKVYNTNNLALQEVSAKMIEAQLNLEKIEIENIKLKEKINKLLGFNQNTCLKISKKLLNNNDYFCYGLEILEDVALNERLDLKIAYLEIERLSRILGIKEWWTYTDLQVGLAGERDTDGTNTIGPGFSGQLPIFNYGQAARQRICSQLKQARNNLAALKIQILSEVREAHKVLALSSMMINNYHENLLPLYKEILASSEGYYNVMGMGIDKLLRSKQEAVNIQQNYLDAVKTYLIASVNLDRALGGNLACLLFPKEQFQDVK